MKTDDEGKTREHEVVFVKVGEKKLRLIETKTETETSKSTTKTYLDKLGRIVFMQMDTELPNLGSKTRHISFGKYRSPLDFTYSTIYRMKMEGSHVQYKWKIDFTQSKVKTKISHIQKTTTDQLDGTVAVEGHGDGFFLGQAHGSAQSFIFNIPLFMGAIQPGDFAPLVPFEGGKEYSISKPIAFSFQDKSQTRNLFKNQDPPMITESSHVTKGKVTGTAKAEIILTKQIEYPVSDEETVDGFEFQFTFLSDYTLSGQTIYETSTTELSESNKISSKGTGIVAYLGIPVILKLDEHREFEHLGNAYNINYTTKIRRIDEPKQIRVLDPNTMHDAISEAEGTLSKIAEEFVEAIPKSELDLTGPEESTESVEIKSKSSEKVKQPSGEATTETADAEIEKPVKEEISETGHTESKQGDIETPDVRPAREWLKSSEIEQWSASLSSAREFFEENVTTPEDFAGYIQFNQQQLKVNPIMRKAFLSHMSRTYGIDDSRLIDELTAPVEELVDQPVDYIEDLLEPYLQGVETNEPFDWESQREKDIARLESAYDETLDKLENALRENTEAWNDVLSHFKPELRDQPVGILKEFLKVPGGLEDFLSNMEMMSDSFKAMMSTERYLQLCDKLEEIKKMMTLVRDGILVNPSIGYHI